MNRRGNKKKKGQVLVHGLSPNCENQSPWGLIILYSRGVRLIYMVGHKQHTSVLHGSDQRKSKQVKLIPFNPWGVHFQQYIWVFGKKCCLSKLRKCVRHSLDFNCMKQMCETVDRDFPWQAFMWLCTYVFIPASESVKIHSVFPPVTWPELSADDVIRNSCWILWSFVLSV